MRRVMLEECAVGATCGHHRLRVGGVVRQGRLSTN